MKKQFIKLLVCTALVIGATSCKKDKKVETTEAKPVVETVVASETYKTIAENTFVNWEAKKIVGGHKGTIHSSNGMLEVKGDKVVGGNIIIDLNTIKCTDLEDEEGNAKLIGHLKNKDFFDVEQFANGAFQITSISDKAGKTIIAGNLTLKNIKKNIEFPASVSVSNGIANIVSEPFNIDRTEWNINYNSGKLTDAAALGDKLIKDEVGIIVNISAKK